MFLFMPPQLDYYVTAKSHCGEVYVLVPDGRGGQAVKKEDECVTTPDDWKDVKS